MEHVHVLITAPGCCHKQDGSVRNMEARNNEYWNCKKGPKENRFGSLCPLSLGASIFSTKEVKLTSAKTKNVGPQQRSYLGSCETDQRSQAPHLFEMAIV